MAVDLERLVAAVRASCLERCHALLSLADRTPYSPNYGCFDRAFWQYKIKDFPSGMSQEALYPLALALQSGLFPGLTLESRREMQELLNAAALLSLRQQHRNGSIDDYFPFEQAAGATAFSLFAILAALELGALHLPEHADVRIRRRLHWLASHCESGRLSNHEALISLTLAMAGSYFTDQGWLDQAACRCQRLLGWRSSEGWFEEYGGFDVGYETLTFSCLFELSRRLPLMTERLAGVLSAQAAAILTAVEPDGCLGGELFSRGTWNCFSHGLLEYALDQGGDLLGDVLRILSSRFVDAPIVVRDDYVIQHHLWSDLRALALLSSFAEQSSGVVLSAASSAGSGTSLGVALERSLPEAGHFWIRHGALTTHVSVRLGGAFRLYRHGSFLVQETQNAVRLTGGRARAWVAHAQTPSLRWMWESPTMLVVEGSLTAYQAQTMTTVKLVVLRLLMACGGRFWPDGIRRLMQKMLINARSDISRTFRRCFHFSEEALIVIDAYRLPGREVLGADICPTGFSSFRHVVMSRMFHPYALLQQAPSRCRVHRSAGALEVEREW